MLSEYCAYQGIFLCYYQYYQYLHYVCVFSIPVDVYILGVYFSVLQSIFTLCVYVFQYLHCVCFSAFQSMFALSEYCPSLRFLQARECRDVTMPALQRLADRGVKVDVVWANRRKLTAAHAKHIKTMKLLPM